MNELEKLAEAYTPTGVDEMTRMSADEGDEWVEELMQENDAQVWYSAMVYGSSYGPDLESIIAGDTDEDATDDGSLCDELEEAIQARAQENLSGYSVVAYTDDNCIWVVAVPESAEVGRA